MGEKVAVVSVVSASNLFCAQNAKSKDKVCKITQKIAENTSFVVFSHFLTVLSFLLLFCHVFVVLKKCHFEDDLNKKWLH